MVSFAHCYLAEYWRPSFASMPPFLFCPYKKSRCFCIFAVAFFCACISDQHHYESNFAHRLRTISKTVLANDDDKHITDKNIDQCRLHTHMRLPRNKILYCVKCLPCIRKRQVRGVFHISRKLSESLLQKPWRPLHVILRIRNTWRRRIWESWRAIRRMVSFANKLSSASSVAVLVICFAL